MPQNPAAHHGRKGKRHNSRNEDRDPKGDGKLAKEPAYHVAHKKERNEHRDKRNGQRHDGKGYLFRAFERRVKRFVALFDVARDVFDHHDGVVDHKPRGNGQGHEREIVKAEVEQVHDPESPNERNRDRNTRNDRCRERAQKKEYHHDDQGHREHEFELHVAHRRLNGGGPVGKNGNRYARGHAGLELGQQFFDVVDHRDDIGAGLPLDVDDHRGRVVHPGRQPLVFNVVDHLGHVGKPYGRALLKRDDERPVFGA